MRIAIVTLPLHVNYGGLLQAYALKHCLESMGHEVTVLDRKVKMPLPSLWTHGLQHTRLPCPSPTPRACSNSCPSSW